MTSRKGAAKARQRAAFEAGAGDLGDLFAREECRRAEASAAREAALRLRACESKNRYASLADAEEAIASCAAYGTRGLHAYRCPHCSGWHLTSKPARP